MGLSISVGLLYDQARNDLEGLEHHRRAFARLSRALADAGIQWQEPGMTEPPSAHTFSGGFPYSYLIHLRRVFALVACGDPVTPAMAVDDKQYARDRRRILDEMSMLSSHLLCHSDSSGYYVPVDFGDPLFLDAEAGVAGGGMVGSSHRLLAELVGIAPSIGIRLDDGGVLSDEEAGRLATFPSDDPFEPERTTWYQLYRACLASIADGHAIVFH
ncbi:hypothetical protein F7Q99_33415 [Streptomyces kaniharaensis]|uniref:Uncharacterized protein n=1 Tax=Streptomyces kaniharaensis TaxID=212423 RepID=A0A6N7L358_9ACTN|nr:hypothetical protein [Streptomyces kaniharaensis]MQS16958.1 hypothetical protein [Streptomyces kaniharaensis]